jgi:hypothetical protein
MCYNGVKAGGSGYQGIVIIRYLTSDATQPIYSSMV